MFSLRPAHHDNVRDFHLGRRRRCGYGLRVLELEDRTLLSSATPGIFGDLPQAIPISVGSQGSTTQSGQIPEKGSLQLFQIDTPADGMLVAKVHPQFMTTSLALLDSQGRLLMQSDGLALGNADDLIETHLPTGTYYLEVEGTGGAGNFTLTTSLTPAYDAFQQIGDNSVYNEPIAVGDFNNDGIPDLATPNALYLGVGDGTFQDTPIDYNPSASSLALISGDFTGDGGTDLVVANTFSDTISVFRGNGDGSFLQPPEQYEVGDGPISIVAGDFAENGRLDLAVVNQADGTVSVLMNNGNGTFQQQVTYEVGNEPTAITEGDFSGNGRLDLAIVNQADGTVSVLMNNGNGTFQQQVTYEVGDDPDAIVAGDFTGDGRFDLAVVNSYSNDISVLLSNDNGAFQQQTFYAAGSSPDAIVAGDFNDDGRLDLAVANSNSNDVSVLQGNGDGSFQPQTRFAAGDGPSALVAADFNGDGRLDLAIANSNSDEISVLLGNGNGAFYGQTADQIPVGTFPNTSVTGDFNGNGWLDLATANALSNQVSILTGNGDGTFQESGDFSVGNDPSALVASDFNADGRLDLAVTNKGDGTVSILMGNGDGTFQPQVTYNVGDEPDAIVAGDFNGDGRLDLAIANEGDGTVSILMGNGDGTFQPQVTYTVGDDPDAIVAGDFNGDGRLDLAIANEGDGTVSILMGNGDGTFQPQVTYTVGDDPSSIVAGDFNQDGRLDLAVANEGDDTVSVLLGDGDGTFQTQIAYPTGFIGGGNLISGDFGGNGRLDLAIGNGYLNSVSVLPGNGDGTFQAPEPFGVGAYVDSVLAGDFNEDGQLDLAAIIPDPATVPVLLGNGYDTFAPADLYATAPDTTPLVADLNGDGIDDVLVVNAAGDILYRQGLSQGSDAFAPPVAINPGNPSRGIAYLPRTDQGPMIASVDAQDDAISFYTWRDGGFIRLDDSLSTGRIPAQIIAADLYGDGLDDLVVRNAGDGTLSVFMGTAFNESEFVGPYDPQHPPLGFLAPIILTTGLGASDVEAVDTSGSGRLDLVVTSQVSGAVSLFLNQGTGTFAAPTVFRGGDGISSVEDSNGSPQVLSLEDTAGLAAGPLTTGGPTDLLVVNHGSNTLDVLAGLGQGQFANPAPLPTQEPARVIRMADFNHDGITDLALLTANGVEIELGNGQSGFSQPVTYDTGPDSTGLTITDINNDGNPDMLVSNAFGDLLVLLGKGDGTFQPYINTNQTITLAVADLTGNGSNDVIYADSALDRVVVAYGSEGSDVVGNRTTGLLDPGAVALADLNGDGIPDLIVANSGSNNILIYPGLGNGQFGPAVNDGHGYFVGTNPVGITVYDLTGEKFPNGNARLDIVVANQGSNDVSILLNQGDFQFTPGPRLIPGGLGPVSTVVGYFTGGTYPDILVTESGSNDVRLLTGVGDGFFNDTNPIIYAVGTDPMTTFVGNFDGHDDMVTIDAGSNDLTLISSFNSPSWITETIPSGGTDPFSAFAFASSAGFENLVVGNAGDGILSLFEGGPKGLILTRSETEPDLPNPSDLSYLGQAGGQVIFYAVTEGRENALLVALSLVANAALIAPAPALNDVVQPISLQDSALSLAGTLLTLTLEPTNGDFDSIPVETLTASGEALLIGAEISVGQAVASRLGEGFEIGPGDEVSNAEHATAEPLSTGSSTRNRLILGLDEALEQFAREHQDQFSSSNDTPSGIDPPRIGPATQTPSTKGPSRPPWVPGELEGIHKPDTPHSPRQSGQTVAISAIMNRLDVVDAHSDRPNPMEGTSAGTNHADSPCNLAQAEPFPQQTARVHPVSNRTADAARCATLLLVAICTYVRPACGFFLRRTRYPIPNSHARGDAFGVYRR